MSKEKANQEIACLNVPDYSDQPDFLQKQLVEGRTPQGHNYFYFQCDEQQIAAYCKDRFNKLKVKLATMDKDGVIDPDDLDVPDSETDQDTIKRYVDICQKLDDLLGSYKKKDLPSIYKKLLRFDTMPCPFLGNFNNAKITYAMLNPGFALSDISDVDDRTNEGKTRLNIIKESLNPFANDACFYVFDANFIESTGGGKYWRKKILKQTVNKLKKQGLDEKTFLKSFAVIQYMPYHSVEFSENKFLHFESQNFVKWFIRTECGKSNVHFVLARKVPEFMRLALGVEAVNNLVDQNRLFGVHNLRTPYFSRANLSQYNERIPDPIPEDWNWEDITKDDSSSSEIFDKMIGILSNCDKGC